MIRRFTLPWRSQFLLLGSVKSTRATSHGCLPISLRDPRFAPTSVLTVKCTIKTLHPTHVLSVSLPRSLRSLAFKPAHTWLISCTHATLLAPCALIPRCSVLHRLRDARCSTLGRHEDQAHLARRSSQLGDPGPPIRWLHYRPPYCAPARPGECLN